jgi:AcrR family transcriptional regulator
MESERKQNASGSGPAAAAVKDDQAGSRSARLTADRELAILRAAYELLGEVGYEALRFDAVAVRARASKATLYRHWAGKPQLIASAVRSCKAGAKEMPDTGSLRGDLVAVLRIMSASMAGEDGPLLAALVMAMRSDEELAAELRAMFDSHESGPGLIVTRAIERGELAPTSDPDLIQEIAPAMLFMHSFARGEVVDDAYLDHLIDDVLLPLLKR